jgi:hypothetical protein
MNFEKIDFYYKMRIVNFMKPKINMVIGVLGLSFMLVTAIALISVKNNVATAQGGNATLDILGNKSSLEPSFTKLSEKLSQIADKLGLNTTLSGNISKDNVAAFLAKLQSNESGVNMTELSNQPLNISKLAEKFVQLLKERAEINK